ncbi:Theileria-specific sub-telomeric protein, SVSP family [Theileria annulata]|uniref:Conserved Theileria-specific sub-telomeric protein, SVSP family n=1 Tax=Theileria annulata TaxID=5874 RepID=Q4UFX2_THEAN|nr:Theileria-specific sub-telomeric protein, SVSP family [Theileria annulata]CAI74017.1 conserved Theileria-specific sub-telomeric protein, SVSP family [Theileria annulata]|eukprot:XP_954697.1 conserved Theileria-specific sub-telomeric protein, SVSP family [Theileria annulata]
MFNYNICRSPMNILLTNNIMDRYFAYTYTLILLLIGYSGCSDKPTDTQGSNSNEDNLPSIGRLSLVDYNDSDEEDNFQVIETSETQEEQTEGITETTETLTEPVKDVETQEDQEQLEPHPQPQPPVYYIVGPQPDPGYYPVYQPPIQPTPYEQYYQPPQQPYQPIYVPYQPEFQQIPYQQYPLPIPIQPPYQQPTPYHPYVPQPTPQYGPYQPTQQYYPEPYQQYQPYPQPYGPEAQATVPQPYPEIQESKIFGPTEDVKKGKICNTIRFMKMDKEGSLLPMIEGLDYKLMWKNANKKKYEFMENFVMLLCDNEVAYFRQSPKRFCRYIIYNMKNGDFTITCDKGMALIFKSDHKWKKVGRSVPDYIKFYSQDSEGYVMLIIEKHYYIQLSPKGSLKYKFKKSVKCSKIIVRDQAVWEKTSNENHPIAVLVTKRTNLLVFFEDYFVLFSKKQGNYTKLFSQKKHEGYND